VVITTQQNLSAGNFKAIPKEEFLMDFIKKIDKAVTSAQLCGSQLPMDFYTCHSEDVFKMNWCFRLSVFIHTAI